MKSITVMRTLALTTLLLLIISGSIKAQNQSDAFRYSQTQPSGTARFTSMGGAFTALGGDYSSLSLNPAGIAIYRGNEFTITPNLNFTKVGSNFLGVSDEDIKYDFAIQNVGFVLAFNDPNQLKENGWIGFQMGFGFSNQFNFNSRRIYEGFNTQSSLMSVFLDNANSQANFNSPEPESFLDDYTTGLAWDTWLLGLDTITDEFFVDMPNNVLQRQTLNTSGSIRELNISFGGNYGNRLYMGATLGFPFLRYESESSFIEENSQGIDSEFNSLEFKESLRTTGTGFNFKFGLIYRASDMIRLGASVHTPTFFNLEEEWNTSMSSDLVSFGRRSSSSPDNFFNYDLTTPLRVNGGVGLIFGSAGILSLDYEFADYSQMRLRSDDDVFTNENRDIQDIYQQQHAIRAGGEIRANPVIFRAGYAMYTNPYTNDFSELQRSTISAGIGIRERSYFVDMGYYYNIYKEEFFPYYSFNRSTANSVDFESVRQGFLLTVGFRF
jgi:hypothetical protein